MFSLEKRRALRTEPSDDDDDDDSENLKKDARRQRRRHDNDDDSEACSKLSGETQRVWAQLGSRLAILDK